MALGVGVNRSRLGQVRMIFGCPHLRGGEPLMQFGTGTNILSSPRVVGVNRTSSARRA